VLKVLIDTNFLMIPTQYKVDIFAELERILIEKYQIQILQSTIEELKKIASTKTKHNIAAKVALELIKQKNLKILKNSEYVDKAILEIADKDTIVCTQDQELKQALKKNNIRIIALRSKKYLGET
jgi:rRNA-processing protein FCF1